MVSVQRINRGASKPAVDISENKLFEVLANQRRRFAVHLLKREERPMEIGRMAEQIAAWENDVDAAEITGNERKRVYTALQQSHLPKMDSVGIVEFDKDRGIVKPTPAIQNVELHVDVVQDKEIPWSEYYLGLSGVAAALVAAVWMGTWPFTLLPEFAWTAAIVVAFAVSALTHRYYTTEITVGNTDEPPELH